MGLLGRLALALLRALVEGMKDDSLKGSVPLQLSNGKESKLKSTENENENGKNKLARRRGLEWDGPLCRVERNKDVAGCGEP